VTGPVKRLKGCLFHYTYDDLSDQISTQNRFSTIASKGLFLEPRRFSGLGLIFRPIFRFFKGYILKRGFLDGYRGFIIATLIAMGVFFKYAKLWEMTFITKPAPDAKTPPANPDQDDQDGTLDSEDNGTSPTSSRL
jgi:hypothetical protein